VGSIIAKVTFWLIKLNYFEFPVMDLSEWSKWKVAECLLPRSQFVVGSIWKEDL